MVVCPTFDRTTRVCNRVVDLGLARSEVIIGKAAVLGEAQRRDLKIMIYRTQHYLCIFMEIVERAACPSRVH